MERLPSNVIPKSVKLLSCVEAKGESSGGASVEAPGGLCARHLRTIFGKDKNLQRGSLSVSPRALTIST